MFVRYLGTGELALPTWVWNDADFRRGKILEALDVHKGWDGRDYYVIAYKNDTFEMATEHFEVVEG